MASVVHVSPYAFVPAHSQQALEGQDRARFLEVKRCVTTPTGYVPFGLKRRTRVLINTICESLEPPFTGHFYLSRILEE